MATSPWIEQRIFAILSYTTQLVSSISGNGYMICKHREPLTFFFFFFVRAIHVGCEAPNGQRILYEKFYNQDVQALGVHPSRSCQISCAVQGQRQWR